MRAIVKILTLIAIYFFTMSSTESYCFYDNKNNIAGIDYVKQKKPKLIFLENVYFKHSKKKQPLGGVNCIFNDGNYLLLGTERGLVKFNKKNFRAERITSKRYNVQKVVKDKGVYWMVVSVNMSDKKKLIKFKNGIFKTIYRQKKDSQNYDVLKSDKINGVWIIKKEYNSNYRSIKIIVENTLAGVRNKPFVLEADIYDYSTDNKGSLWIASSEGIYEIKTNLKNNIISNRFAYLTNRLQILNNSNAVRFISGDTLYRIDDGKLIMNDYRAGINGTIYVNNSYLKHIENIGSDDNSCASGLMEINDNSIKVFNEVGLVNDTEKVFASLKKHYYEDYMEYVKKYNILSNGNFIFLVSGHGRAVHCYDGIYIFDGLKVVQIGNLTSSDQMIIDNNKVWIPDGSDWHMVPERIGGGLYLYEY